VTTLERWAAEHPKLKGIRPVLQDLPDADYARWIDVSDTLIAPLSAGEQDAIRLANAARFYGLTP
jgi:hypothetical protein